MVEARFKNVADYLAQATPEAQNLLRKLQAVIKTTVPEAEEKISYNVPFYWYHGDLVGFSVHQNHLSFGFGQDVLAAEMRAELVQKGYKLGKGTLQIKFTQELPILEIEQILKNKVLRNETKENEASK